MINPAPPPSALVPGLTMNQLKHAQDLHRTVLAIRDQALAETQQALKRLTPRIIRQTRHSLNGQEKAIQTHLLKLASYLEKFPTDPKQLMSQENFDEAVTKIGEMNALLDHQDSMEEIRLSVAALHHKVIEAAREAQITPRITTPRGC